MPFVCWTGTHSLGKSVGNTVLQVLSLSVLDDEHEDHELTELVNLRSAGTRASSSSANASSSSVPTTTMSNPPASVQQHLPANDVAWGLKSRGGIMLSTAAASGAVVLWSLSPGSSTGKLERILTEHSRAVNRVTFHPSEGSLLLSASQDGSMKLW